MNAKHTATPWKVTEFDNGKMSIEDANGECPLVQKNAAHIVRCVNSHDALLAALAAIAEGDVMRKQGLQPGEYMAGDVIVEYQAIARAALKQARGEA